VVCSEVVSPFVVPGIAVQEGSFLGQLIPKLHYGANSANFQMWRGAICIVSRAEFSWQRSGVMMQVAASTSPESWQSG
jgi:hypothetical protein